MGKKIGIAVVVFVVILSGLLFYKTTNIQVKKNTEQEPISTPTLTSTEPEKQPGVLGQGTIVSTPSATSIKSVQKGPYPMEIDIKKKYTAILTTTVGVITIQLNASATPVTVNNFVVLSRKNFYNNTIFHRVIKGFMIQGGDPKGNGTGGPGYTFDDEPFEGEYMRGTVAMANAGPNTNGSQFFIMHKDTPLPKNYVIFGKATTGMDVVDKIAESPTKPGGEGSTPVSPTTITTVTIKEE